MPKRKIETASEAERELSSTSNSKRGPRGVSANNNDQQQQQQQQQHDTDNYNQAPPSPPTKRLRAPLNFSIESLMQPSQQQLIAQNQALNVSRSPSPAGSDAGSSASGASTNTLASDQAPYLSQQQQQHLMSNGMRDTLESLASSSSSSRSSSRVSSPISPGCNPAITSTISNTTTSVAGLAKQHEKMAPTPPSNGSLHNLASRASIQPSNGQHSHQNHNQATAIQQQQAGPSATSGPNTTTTTSSSKGSKGHRSGGHSSNSRIKPVCTDSRLAPFECHLDNLELWHRFHPLDTEMIITKQGRRMFPPVRVTFSFNEQLLHQQQAANRNQLQFNSRDRYQVLMDILPYDNKRYRYAYHKSSWQQAGKADPPSPTKLFLHPDGPFTLDQLKRQVISFEKIKLTNNDANKHGYIVLNSMHKYQPRIHLILWRGKESQSLANGPINLLDQEAHKTFIFSETIFTAVTAYQNHSITKLKIDSNPFAKGFRDSTRLTDLELESMQDLIADGQCPFSPPRAPPPGFPHFLFAAAQHPQFGNGHLHHQLGQQTFAGGQPQQQHLGPAGSTTGPTKQQENATAALLRERTIMALDSFLQQQQQHHHHQQQHQPAPNSESPTAGGPKVQQTPTSEQQAGAQRPACHSPSSPQMPPNSTPFSPAHFASFLNAAGGPPPPSYQQLISLNHQHHNNNNQGQPIVSMAPAGQSQNQAGQLEQFILQQQQQFAAAMAAAATGVHQHPAYLQSLFAQAAAAQQQQQSQAPPPVGSTTPTGCAAAKLISSSSSPPGRQQMPPATTVVTSQALQQQQQQHHHHHHLEQTSPIGMAKSANRMQLQDLNQFLSAGGPTGNSHSHPLQVPVTSSAAGNQQQQQQQQQQQFHLQALMQQHHQQMQQMAALAQQHQKHHQPSCLQVEPQLITQSHELEASGPVSRKASTKTTSQK